MAQISSRSFTVFDLDISGDYITFLLTWLIITFWHLVPVRTIVDIRSTFMYQTSETLISAIFINSSQNNYKHAVTS
jgi:hypothetical protein